MRPSIQKKNYILFIASEYIYKCWYWLPSILKLKIINN